MAKKVKHLAAESDIEKSDPRSIENLRTVLTNGTFHNLCTTMYNNHHQITFHNLCTTITTIAIATCRTRIVNCRDKDEDHETTGSGSKLGAGPGNASVSHTLCISHSHKPINIPALSSQCAMILSWW